MRASKRGVERGEVEDAAGVHRQDFGALAKPVAFERCDVLASPTAPIPSWRLGTKVDDPLAVYLLDVFTIGANLAGLPAISIPAGFTASAPRLPIGVQLVGPRLGEPALLRVAAAHEAASSWHRERPPLFADALTAVKRTVDPNGILNPGVVIG